MLQMEAPIPFIGPTYNLPINEFYPAVDGTLLDADAWNAVADDLATALSSVLTKDGAGSMSGSLNMGSNKIVSLSAATNPGDAPRFDQIQPVDATLTAIAALAFDATNNLMYSTGADTFALLATTAAGRTVLTFVDPNTDQILFWDDSEGKFTGLTLGTGLSITTTTLNLSANLQAWSALTPGTAATKNTGTSGNNVPLLDGANTWSAVQTYTANTPIVLQSDQAAFHFKEGGGSDRFLLGIRSDISGNDTDFLLYSLGVGTVFQVPQSTRVADFKAVPTINGVAIITGSSPTLSNPTLSGTVAGAVTFSGNSTFSGGAPIFSNLATSMPAAGSGGTLKFSNGDTNYGILFAVSNANGAGFIQAQRTDGTGTVYALSLNPNGGDIIGNSTGPTSVYSLGYRGLGNLNGQNNAYTFVLADAGRNVYHSTGTHAFEIPPNSSVPFPIGTAIEILNFGGTLTITEGSGVTLYRWDGTSGTGTRTVGQRSTAVIQKITTTEWIIMGAALT